MNQCFNDFSRIWTAIKIITKNTRRERDVIQDANAYPPKSTKSAQYHCEYLQLYLSPLLF